MLASASPYSQYFNLDGSPLDAGSIYIGTANQNPETSPITVYWDAAGTQPAAQPLSTVNGFIARAGTPAIAYVSSDYSITARDSSGRIVFYAPSSAAFINDSLLRAELASQVDATKGAGMIGFGYGLAYAAGSMGRWLQDLATTVGSTFIGFIQSGAGAVLRTVQAVLRELPVSVVNFGADPTGAADSTAAFTAAQVVSKRLQMPPGTFKLTNFAMLNGTVLRGDGILSTFVTQGANGSPAISVTTSTITGNYQGLEASGFTLNGSAAPTVAAFQVTCTGAGALWRCLFEFAAQNTYKAFDVAAAGTNFFRNKVRINSEGSVTTAVHVQSGTYNEFDLFLTNCADSTALDHGGIDDKIWVTADGQVKSSGLNTDIDAKVENLYGTALAAGEAVISMTGTNQKVKASVILPLGSAAKCTYAFKPSNGTTFENPYVTSSGGATLANPFNVNAGFQWTLIGGKSDCTNKMETIYDDSDNTHSLRYVTMVGDVSQLSATVTTRAGKTTQKLTPGAPFSLTVKGNTDRILIKGAGPIATAQFNLINGLIDGRPCTLRTVPALTAITWVSTADVTDLPGTLAANGHLSFFYDSADNKLYVDAT